jgi:thiol:disulfide interchange protein DsbD
MVVLNWEVADGYYLYLNKFKFRSLTEGMAAGEPELPKGETRHDEFFGEVRIARGLVEVWLPLARTAGAGDRLSLEVGSQGCADAGLCYPPRREYFEVDFASGSVTPVAAPAREATVEVATGAMTTTGTLLYMLLLAFVGGAILNLMPCVLPILSLKALGLAGSGESVAKARSHALWYTAGVVLK